MTTEENMCVMLNKGVESTSNFCLCYWSKHQMVNAVSDGGNWDHIQLYQWLPEDDDGGTRMTFPWKIVQHSRRSVSVSIACTVGPTSGFYVDSNDVSAKNYHKSRVVL